jgi:hypothetical protein
MKAMGDGNFEGFAAFECNPITKEASYGYKSEDVGGSIS